jgi:hypothetical protein
VLLGGVIVSENHLCKEVNHVVVGGFFGPFGAASQSSLASTGGAIGSARGVEGTSVGEKEEEKGRPCDWR